jgi:hypothetical protein
VKEPAYRPLYVHITLELQDRLAQAVLDERRTIRAIVAAALDAYLPPVKDADGD